MPCGIIQSGRAPKSIVVTLTCVDLPTAKGWQNRRFFNVLPKHAHLKNERVCSCTTTVYVNLSMNSFMMLTRFFVPESGCKGRTFLNITQAFLRKMFKRNARFHISLHNINKRGEYTLIYIGAILRNQAHRHNHCRHLGIRPTPYKDRNLGYANTQEKPHVISLQPTSATPNALDNMFLTPVYKT